MNKPLLLAFALLCGLASASAQTGTWSGNLDVNGTKLPLVFHFDEESPTLDSPLQGAKGIPMQVTKSAPYVVSISIPAVGATYKGVYSDTKIRGTFSQMGHEFPLILSKGEVKANRPQTPQPPYPYAQEEVSFTNGTAVLKGTLTLPQGYTKSTPVVIMITGSGLQNRDEEIFEHKPFAVLADYLARNGIATLRYDDRGFGESTGDVANCTTEDLMQDALAGIELLRSRFGKVGALGHSEGGTIAFMLAADSKVDFAVSLAGMVISGKETLLEQNRYALSQAGYPQQVIDEYCHALSQIFAGGKPADASSLPTELQKNLTAIAQQVSSPYMQYFLALDIRGQLGKIKCPVLAINGTKDTQVSAKPNLEAIQTSLTSNAKHQIISLEGLNHLFQHCQTGAISEYGQIEETISPDVLSLISGWISK